MDDRSIDDSQITASSNTRNYLPNYGRLNNIKSANMGGSWCAGTSDVNQYLQIDMKKKMTFSGIATQGAGDAQNWLTKFKIMKSNDGSSFTVHTEFGIAKVRISMDYLI
jgi:lactadherin